MFQQKSMAQLEELSIDELRAYALEEGTWLQEQQARQSEFSDAEQHSAVQSEAARLGAEALAKRLPMDRLKELSDAQVTELQRQEADEQRRIQLETDEIQNRAARKKSYDDMTLEELCAVGAPIEIVQERESQMQAQQKIAASPEGRAEQATRDLQRETEDLQFVHDQLRTKNDKELNSLVAQKVAEAQAYTDAQNAIQQRFVDSHPAYLPIPENANAMVEFVRGAGYADWSESNLSLAYQVLKNRGQLKLRTAEQVQQQNELREAIVNPPQQRRSSSVSANRGSSMYDKPVKKFEEDSAYELPLDELRKRAEAQLGQSTDYVISNFR